MNAFATKKKEEEEEDEDEEGAQGSPTPARATGVLYVLYVPHAYSGYFVWYLRLPA